MTSTDNFAQPSIGHQSQKIWAPEEEEQEERRRLLEAIVSRFQLCVLRMIYLSTRRTFSCSDWGWRGAAGKLRNEWREPPWPRFDKRESKTKKKKKKKEITIALVPTTLCGNKWLFNISMHTKRQKKKNFIRMVMNKTKRSNKKEPRLQQQRASAREEICGVSKNTSSFYLMGAAAVMHPRGPHVNNWTDIGAAPAGSPNHRRGFEQTAVTLRHQAWQRSAAKHRQREEEGGKRRRKGGGKKKKRMHSRRWMWPGATE